MRIASHVTGKRSLETETVRFLSLLVLSPMFIFEAFEPNVALFSTEHSIRWCWDHIFFWAVIVPWVIDWTKTIFLSSSRKNTKSLGLLLNWKIFFGILSKKGSFLSWFDFSKNRKINLRFPCCSLTPSERIGGRNCSNKTIFFYNTVINNTMWHNIDYWMSQVVTTDNFNRIYFAYEILPRSRMSYTVWRCCLTFSISFVFNKRGHRETLLKEEYVCPKCLMQIVSLKRM